MSVVVPGSNTKTPFYEVSAEATDLLDGASVAFGALTNPVGPGFPAGSRGFNSGSAGYNQFADGSVIYARDTGRLWIVQRATPSTKVLVLITEYSVDGTTTTPSTEIAFVVAAAGYGLASTKSFTTIDGALAAIAGSGLTRADIILLPGSYAQPTTSIPSATDISMYGITGNADQVHITAGANDLTLAAGANLNLANLSITPAVAACIALGAGPNTIDALNVTFNGVGDTINSANVVTFTARQCRFGAPVVLTNAGASFTARNCESTQNITLSGGGTVTLRECNTTGTTSGGTVLIQRSGVGVVNATSINVQQSTTGNVSTTGSLTAGNSQILGSCSVSTTSTMDHCRVTGVATFSGAHTSTDCVFQALVTFSAAAPTTHNLSGDSFSSTTQCITTGANDTVVLTRCTAESDTGVAIDGSGTAQIIGGLAGGGRVSTSSVTTSVSDVQVRGSFYVSLVADDDLNTLVTGLADMIYVNPSPGGAPRWDLTLFDGGVVPDGFVITLTNDSNSVGFDVVASAGDAFASGATTTIGPLDSRTYCYERTGSTATIREI